MSAIELEALLLSLKVGLASTALCLPFALAVSWLLSRTRMPGRALLDAVVHAPLVLPPVVIGYLLLISLGTRAPLGAWLKDTLGVQLIFTTEGVVVAAAVMAFPLMVRAIRLSLDTVDRGIELAARTLGASRTDVLLSITLPMMLPGILSGSMMAFAASLGEFGATITFASNIEGQTRTLPLAIYTATQTPDGDAIALRLVGLSMALAVSAIALSEWMSRRARRWLGRP
ncbi:MAG: molybdate ABC transporter permease subunit [Gammaproteobacteria bacterium]|nr:molybdate ABC transporter permease subunit [Gammaproteobacteria bacterium]MBU0772598.1 molybdate ABC transporter permease subunit [Gammaproteobacteria bacterium]MBU0855198.1 molybdate ABC transporter permease subunit [Gammaproteobacteria bacterium]MBU1847388.1 molybdate ABC transporter permease subunit [Gammaproteobacteria bacterium]